MDTCASFGTSADYLIRHKMAKAVSKQEMPAKLQLCRELGLVFSADNVKQNLSFICCCCNLLQGINKFGYANSLVTPSFIASINKTSSTGCGRTGKQLGDQGIKKAHCANNSSGPSKHQTPSFS